MLNLNSLHNNITKNNVYVSNEALSILYINLLSKLTSTHLHSFISKQTRCLNVLIAPDLPDLLKTKLCQEFFDIPSRHKHFILNKFESCQNYVQEINTHLNTKEIKLLCNDTKHLPYANEDVDLVLLPMTLNCIDIATRKQLIQELSQALSYKGQMLIIGVNPHSFYGVSAKRYIKTQSKNSLFKQQLFSIACLKNELEDNDLQIHASRYFHYMPFTKNEKSRHHQWFHLFDKAGARWWPNLASGYVISVKHKSKLIKLNQSSWKTYIKPSINNIKGATAKSTIKTFESSNYKN